MISHFKTSQHLEKFYFLFRKFATVGILIRVGIHIVCFLFWHENLLWRAPVAKWSVLPTSDHEVPGSNSAGIGNSTHDCMALHCTEPFIITLPLSWYDLNNVERDIKHQTHIITPVVGTQKHLTKMLLMSTKDMFSCRNKNYVNTFPLKKEASGGREVSHFASSKPGTSCSEVGCTISAPHFRSRSPGFAGDKIQLMSVCHSIAQMFFIITLPLSWYDLNIVERDVKWQTMIIIYWQKVPCPQMCIIIAFVWMSVAKLSDLF